MSNFFIMKIEQGLKDFCYKTFSYHLRNSSLLFDLLVHVSLKISLSAVFEDDIPYVAYLKIIQTSDDVLMIQGPQYVDLIFYTFGIILLQVLEYFDSNTLFRVYLEAFVDFGISSLTKQLFELIPFNDFAFHLSQDQLQISFADRNN